MVYPLPFTGPPPENGVVIARGSYGFLNVQVTVNNQAYTPDALTYANIRRIEDPDGADITATWVTNALDPAGLVGGGADVYDENHASYVGDLVAPENFGLFQSASFVAQKIKVPVGAEETVLNGARSYKIFYDLQIGGVTITDGDGELYETFNVGPPGVLIWDSGLITVDEVKSGITTTLTDPEIEVLIDRATARVRSKALGMCKVDIALETTLDDCIREAIVTMTQMLIVNRDASSGGIPTMLKQGTKQRRTSGSSDKLAERFMGEVDSLVGDFCRVKRSYAKFRTHRQTSGDGNWDPLNTSNDTSRR